MKNKIIAVILSISVISCIFVISCFATVDEILPNTKYTYNKIDPTLESQYYNFNISISGNFNGYYYDNTDQVERIGNINFTKIIKSQTTLFLHTYINGEFHQVQLSNSNNNDVKGYGFIEFDQTITDTNALKYFKAALSEYNAMDENYMETYNFLNYIVTNAKSIINYMITNNIILIVIAIVIVSFAIGTLIRISRKKI